MKNLFTVVRVGNKVNLSGEEDKKVYGKKKTVRFDNVLRNVRKEDGREFFEFDNMKNFIDELEEWGVTYIA